MALVIDIEAMDNQRVAVARYLSLRARQNLTRSIPQLEFQRPFPSFMWGIPKFQW
jgi:hypothetical protein